MVNIIITEHDGKTHKAQVNSFDAQAVADKLNDRELIFVAFGGIVLSRAAVKSVYEEKDEI